MYEDLVKRLRTICPENYSHPMDFAYGVQQAMHEAADAIEDLKYDLDLAVRAEAAAVKAYTPCWIPVTERLPEDGVYVLGRYENNEMAVVCVFDHDEDITFWRAQTDKGWEADCDTEPTHWQPLPEPPEEGE